MSSEIYYLLYITYKDLNLFYAGDGGHGALCFGLGNASLLMHYLTAHTCLMY